MIFTFSHLISIFLKLLKYEIKLIEMTNVTVENLFCLFGWGKVNEQKNSISWLLLLSSEWIAKPVNLVKNRDRCYFFNLSSFFNTIRLSSKVKILIKMPTCLVHICSQWWLDFSHSIISLHPIYWLTTDWTQLAILGRFSYILYVLRFEFHSLDSLS